MPRLSPIVFLVVFLFCSFSLWSFGSPERPEERATDPVPMQEPQPASQRPGVLQQEDEKVEPQLVRDPEQQPAPNPVSAPENREAGDGLYTIPQWPLAQYQAFLAQGANQHLRSETFIEAVGVDFNEISSYADTIPGLALERQADDLLPITLVLFEEMLVLEKLLADRDPAFFRRFAPFKVETLRVTPLVMGRPPRDIPPEEFEIIHKKGGAAYETVKAMLLAYPGVRGWGKTNAERLQNFESRASEAIEEWGQGVGEIPANLMRGRSARGQNLWGRSLTAFVQLATNYGEWEEEDRIEALLPWVRQRVKPPWREVLEETQEELDRLLAYPLASAEGWAGTLQQKRWEVIFLSFLGWTEGEGVGLWFPPTDDVQSAETYTGNFDAAPTTAFPEEASTRFDRQLREYLRWFSVEEFSFSEGTVILMDRSLLGNYVGVPVVYTLRLRHPKEKSDFYVVLQVNGQTVLNQMNAGRFAFGSRLFGKLPPGILTLGRNQIRLGIFPIGGKEAQVQVEGFELKPE